MHGIVHYYSPDNLKITLRQNDLTLIEGQQFAQKAIPAKPTTQLHPLPIGIYRVSQISRNPLTTQTKISGNNLCGSYHLYSRRTQSGVVVLN